MLYEGLTVTHARGAGVVRKVGVSPYDARTTCAYVVGNGWADWLPLVELSIPESASEAA